MWSTLLWSPTPLETAANDIAVGACFSKSATTSVPSSMPISEVAHKQRGAPTERELSPRQLSFERRERGQRRSTRPHYPMIHNSAGAVEHGSSPVAGGFCAGAARRASANAEADSPLAKVSTNNRRIAPANEHALKRAASAKDDLSI